MRRLLSRLFRLLTSFGLACVVLLLLLLLTYLGTVEQARLGLYEAQKRYWTKRLRRRECMGLFRIGRRSSSV